MQVTADVPEPDVISPSHFLEVTQPVDKPNQREETEIPHLQNYEDFEVEEEGNPNQTKSNKV